MTETLKLPRQARGVSLRAESFNADDNTIEVVFTTGAAVLRYSWGDGAYLETLDVTSKAVRLDRLNKGAPFLNSHASWDLADVIGSVVPGSARIEGGVGVATIKLSGAAADADIVGKIRDGVIRNVSVGYIVWQAVMTEAGEDGSPATCRVTDWEPIEISAVPIPADMDSQIRSAGGKPDANALYSCAVTRAAPAQPAAAAVVTLAPTSADDVRKAETSRVQGLIATTRQLGLPADLADKHVAEGTALDAFRSLAIDAAAALRSTSPTPPSAAPAVQTGETAMTDRANDSHSDDVTRAAPTAPATPPAPLDATAIRTAERERISAIRSIVRKLKLEEAFADRAIDDGSSIEAVRAAAIDAAAERQAPAQQPGVVTTSEPAHRTYAQARAEKPKGTDATRAIVALAATRGSRQEAAAFVAHHYGTDGEAVARALSTSVGSAGGFLVPVEMSAEIIELLRPASTVMAMGPRILPMPSGNMMIPRVTNGSNANYVGENQPIGASQPSFGGAQLSAKKLASLVPISNDMIRYPTASTDAIVREDMVGAIAQKTDLAFLRGQGSQFSPRGLLSFAAALTTSIGSALPPSANKFAASVKVGTAFASVSRDNSSAALQSVTSDLSTLELALEGKDIKMVKPGWVFSPRTKTYLMNIRDGLGNQVYYKEMSEGMLRGKPFKTTTQIPNNLAATSSDGTTATFDGSEIYLADFSEVFIGEAYGLELDVFPGGTYMDASGNMVSGISNDQTVMRAIVQHDMNMRQEAAVAVLTGVRWF